ncbi:hypothetical protein MRB53_005622 [Persea americana]|uniref:Uncharacterized protein n=1 Tax=Persea americana TaxID=3435 RepID=A0ACC2MEV0_PERAE|nr:hypothetical protein MRB53_005622 [Persea americana]
METIRRSVAEIAYTPLHQHRNLPLVHRSLLPFLSLASSLYRFFLFLHQQLYHLGLLKKQRMPVPVISVGNLSWGGNGKTPMVEYIARFLVDAGISPLILTRGYAGGDEAKMLQRHLVRTSAKKLCPDQKLGGSSITNKTGAIILDDGMQHWKLFRDLEIVMINGLMPWGNGQLLPLGPLREPLTALRRADVAVIHHADLVLDGHLKVLESMVLEIKQSLPIFFSRMSPSHFFEVWNCDSKLPLTIVHNMVLLCVSAIGFANAFIEAIEKMGPLYIDRIDFSDHYFIQDKDIEIIRGRIRELKDEFGANPIVIVTEKDYDRDPVILKRLDGFQVLVLCSSLQIMPFLEHTEECFNTLLKNLINQI